MRIFVEGQHAQKVGLHGISAYTSANLKLNVFTRKVEALSLAKPLELIMNVQNRSVMILCNQLHSVHPIRHTLILVRNKPTQCTIMVSLVIAISLTGETILTYLGDQANPKTTLAKMPIIRYSKTKENLLSHLGPSQVQKIPSRHSCNQL